MPGQHIVELIHGQIDNVVDAEGNAEVQGFLFIARTSVAGLTVGVVFDGGGVNTVLTRSERKPSLNPIRKKNL